MEGKSPSQRARFFKRSFANRKYPTESEFENFSLPNYSKFAVKCDWNIKISQIYTKFEFFEKNSKSVNVANLL